MDRIRPFLKFAGKGDRKVAAVFGVAPEHCDRAVRHVRRGAPEVPVWLFCSRQPWDETAALCERVRVEPDSMELLVTAQKELWPRWVALSVAAWTGGHGRWPVKLAPFLVPPFRVVIMNRHGDFFAPSAAAIARHWRRASRDAAHAGWNRAKDIHRGIWLWLFAMVAQRFAWLSRRAFTRWHGTAALEPPPIAATAAGEDTLVYRHLYRHWNWTEVDRLVRESNCRRILFLEGGAVDDLPWVGGTQTFAVSRQPAYRAWKHCLFPVAPFRTLQPGEASRTLVPVSRAILVDRAKLAALGVPHTIVPGTAWLILFWKAAAAGWHSYSVGGSTPLGEMPDWPYEEAEFVTRVLADPALRALGPREPDLARGTVARAVGAPAFDEGWPAPDGTRPRVLVVSPYLPYPLSHGGAVRIWNLCRTLAGRVDFILACFREREDRVEYGRLHDVFREVYAVDRDERALKAPGLPYQVRDHASRSMRALIAALAPRVDLLQVEFTHMAAFRDAAPHLPAILVEHDLTFTLYRQFAEREDTRAAWTEYQRWLAFERRWLPAYDAVWTMSEEDRGAAVAEGSPAAGSYVVANGVDVARFVPCGEPGGAPEVFYVGSFRHLPNILGFEKLRHEVMPRVWERFPEARLRVVAGPEPERYWREFLKTAFPRRMDPRIAVEGFVADLRPLYARAAVVVVPLLVSAGTNIKVMEAMACQKAVVTTPVGCQGLGLVDGRDAAIRKDWAGFAAVVCELLAQPERRAEIAAEARRTVERRFSWEVIADQAYASYRDLRGSR